MSTGIVSATKFFNENSLFELIKLTDGSKDKSYKTKNQEYIMECTKCGQQVEQRGNAKFECRRCRREVVETIVDNEKTWAIVEPTGLAKTKAVENMMKPPKKLVSEEDEDDEEEIPKMPEPSEMIKFLKKTAKKTSGNRIPNKKKAAEDEAAANIDEPEEDVIVPISKKKEKAAPKPKLEIPTVEESKSCPQVKEEPMKIVRLKPGQNFYCKVTKIMYMVDDE